MTLQRLRLDLAYDGSAFAGWARQPDRRTIQGVVEDALATVLRLPVPPALTVAGRTDAGVHARGQVAHVDVPAEVWEPVTDSLVDRLAGILPSDVRVRRAAAASPGFDARFSALTRRYLYRVCDDPTGVDPLRRHDTLWYRRRLDVHRMNRAARELVGEHDFAAFCRRREGATTMRRVHELRWRRVTPDPSLPGHPAPAAAAEATVVADAFCHNMVRALVGALLAVGDGRRPVDWPGAVLRAGVRDPAVQVMPPHGLCLEEIRYPAEAELAVRAEETRRRRVPAD
ncbi:MAG: tRNA pseudouridine(38-40) synthase TruA [Streptosporangiales bacterium]|nr:tRNA pseudouridine(38-40) synthase TruA [Streptosporangiales bacterium]